MYNLNIIKNEFPFFKSHPNLIFLDNAATTQKPQMVIDSLVECYEKLCFPVGRARYDASNQASEVYELIRSTTANFFKINSDSLCLINSATAASNALANAISQRLTIADRIILCSDAHHSLLAPWIINAQKYGFNIDWVSARDDGDFDYEQLACLIKKNTKIIALPLVSHSLGYHVDIECINVLVKKCNEDIYIIFDATQAIASRFLDLSKNVVDALFFSGHKCYAPWGSGALYVSPRLQNFLKDNSPYFGGGSIFSLTQHKVITLPFPQSWEAGSISLADHYGMMHALQWIEKNAIQKKTEITYALFKKKLLDYLATAKCIITSGSTSTSIVSFYHPEIHAHDIAEQCNKKSICVRSGFFCSDIPHVTYEKPALVRISFAAYTTMRDIDCVISALSELKL